MTNNNPTQETAKRPVAKVRIGLLNAYIWPRITDKGTFHNVSFERRYRDKDGQWQSSYAFNQDDLLSLAKLADLAHSKILQLEGTAA